jgi:hypothetical protein
MRAQLKELHSPDVPNLEDWMPDDGAFRFLVQAMIGPLDGEGMESFDLCVCSPLWLVGEMAGKGIRSCEHMVLMPFYDYRLLRNFLEKRIAACEANNWPELAAKVGRIGHWEFDNYKPLQ